MSRLPPRLFIPLKHVRRYLIALVQQLPDSTRETLLDAAEEWLDHRVEPSQVERVIDLLGDAAEVVVAAAVGIVTHAPAAGALAGAAANHAIDAAAPAVGQWAEGLTDAQIARARAWLEAMVDEVIETYGSSTTLLPESDTPVVKVLRKRFGDGVKLPRHAGPALAVAILRRNDALRTALGVTPEAITSVAETF